MLAFSRQEVPPALKSHLEAQFSFLADLSRKMFDGVQRIGQLNVQVAQTVMEEAINSAHQMIESNTPTEYISVAASQVQPVAEKLRAYQQHLSNIAAGVQVELSKTAEEHVPETTRTAAAVAEEVVRRGAEETDKVTQRQKAAFEKLTKPINDTRETPHQNGSMQPPPSSQAGKQQPAAKTA
jgi:phasin family protein